MTPFLSWLIVGPLVIGFVVVTVVAIRDERAITRMRMDAAWLRERRRREIRLRPSEPYDQDRELRP